MKHQSWSASFPAVLPCYSKTQPIWVITCLALGLLLLFFLKPSVTTQAFSHQVEQPLSTLPAAPHLTGSPSEPGFAITLAPSTTLTVTLTPTSTPNPPPPAYLPLLMHSYPLPQPDTPLVDLLLCDSSNRTIPNDIPQGAFGEIILTDSRLIVDLDVYLHIDHTKVGDLKVFLQHEDTGKRVVLVDRPGYPERYFGCSGRNLIAVLDDQASQAVEGKCAANNPSISGSFQPQSALSGFNGDPLGGTWILNVSDHSEDDSGTLRQWCMDVTVTERMPLQTPTPPPLSLPDEARIIGISGRNQALPLDCESRSAVDLAGYFGRFIPELTFFYNLPSSDNPDKGFVGNVYGAWGQIPPYPYGVHAAPVADLLSSYGLNAAARRYLSWDEVRVEIAAGRPVQVWVIGNSSGTMPGRFYPVYYTPPDGQFTVVSPYEHTVIVIGYTENSVTLLDGGAIYNRSLDQFLDSWSVLRNMAIMIAQ
jgi:subtilisin-like proprotein convertase family protein/uncharacterized protein YvpB